MILSLENKMKLHVGCGSVRIPGYVNVDIRYLPNVDVVDNAELLRRFNKETITEIYTCHVLEHFSRWRVKTVLKRWYDLLQPKGILTISVPDFEAIVRRYQEKGNMEELIGLLYGGQEYKENSHYYCWDYKSLKRDLEKVGFVKIRRYTWQTSNFKDFDDYSKCYLPHKDFKNGMLMSLNVVAEKAGKNEKVCS